MYYVVDGDSAKIVDDNEITPQTNYVRIEHDGQLQFNPRLEQSATHCEVDVTWFPFDAQRCFIIFQPWTLKLRGWAPTLFETDELLLYIPSDEWELLCACC